MIEINPEYERAYEMLSDCYASQYKLDQSVATLRKLLEYRQNDSTVYRKLAMFHGQLKITLKLADATGKRMHLNPKK